MEQVEVLQRALDALRAVCIPGPVQAVRTAPAEPPVSVAPLPVPTHDPAEWREPFAKWALSVCAYRDRCFGGIPALCADFGKWAVTHDSVPCRIDTFEALLRDAGFLCADGLVSGLILKSDLWALENSRKETVQCHF